MKTLEFILFCLAMFFYIRNIVLDKDFTPSATAFSIWLVADIVNAITYLDFSDKWIPPIIMLSGAIIVFGLALYRTLKMTEKVKNKLSLTDWLSISISAVALCIFFFTGNSKVANAMIQVVLFTGFLPILAKKAADEPILPWLFFSLGWSVSLIICLDSKVLLEWTYVIIQLLGCFIILILSVLWYYTKGRRLVNLMKRLPIS